MGDWFETRFKEAVDTGELDPEFARRMHALVLKEWEAADGEAPEPSAVHTFEDLEGDVIVIETEERQAPEQESAPHRGRSPGTWLLVAAAVAVIAVVGALLVAGGDEDDDKVGTVATNPDERRATTPTTVAPRPVPDGEGFVTLTSGTYFIDPDGDAATPLRVTFDVGLGWMSWLGAVKFVGDDHLALTIATVSNVAREACRDHSPQSPPVGPTVDDLATALARLDPFQVTSAPKDVTVQGYSGKHLQLAVPNIPVSNDQFVGCFNGNLASWFSPIHDEGLSAFFGYNAEPGRTEDFYILDVDGTRLVLTTMSGPKSRPQDLAELEAMFDSINIEP